MTKMPLWVSVGTLTNLLKTQLLTLGFDPLTLDFKRDELCEKVKHHSEQLLCFTGRLERTRRRSNRPFNFASASAKRLLYDNSSPRPPEEFVSENSDAEIESFSPSPIPVKDIDSLMEEIDLSFTPNYPMPPGIEEDDYDSERDILILEELLSNNSFSILENESFHFDISFILSLMFTQSILVLNQEKSPDLLSHLGLKVFQPSAECPMMIYGKNTPIVSRKVSEVLVIQCSRALYNLRELF
nr:hypothetical protein [Tanacetum cinerariifolium]